MLVILCSPVMNNFLWPPRTVAHQAPMSVEFSRKVYWSGLLFPTPGEHLDPGMGPMSPDLLHWQVDSSSLSHLGSLVILYSTFKSWLSFHNFPLCDWRWLHIQYCLLIKFWTKPWLETYWLLRKVKGTCKAHCGAYYGIREIMWVQLSKMFPFFTCFMKLTVKFSQFGRLFLYPVWSFMTFCVLWAFDSFSMIFFPKYSWKFITVSSVIVIKGK